MSAVVDELLAEFEGKYVRLTWPDKNIILDLTAFCERNIAISIHLSDMIVARIIDPATDISHKLPIFYLIDAVMKHVGGPYPALFSRHLGEVFKRAFDEVARLQSKRIDKSHIIIVNAILNFDPCFHHLVTSQRKGKT
jgi:hypothetical protein